MTGAQLLYNTADIFKNLGSGGFASEVQIDFFVSIKWGRIN